MLCVRAVGRRLKAIPAVLSQYSTSLVTDDSGGAPPECVPGAEEREARQRLLRAAVMGVPNAGKTTLVNQLLRRKVCSYINPTTPNMHY